MKKRRTNPIPLLSVMLLCFVLIGYFNSRTSGDDKNPQQQQQQQQPTNVEPSPAIGKSTAAPTAKDLASRVNIGPTAPGGPGTGPRMPPKPGVVVTPGPGGGAPPMMAHPMKPSRPKPSDSQIGSDWWTDEANKSFSDH